jgi:hypothetical protein
MEAVCSSETSVSFHQIITSKKAQHLQNVKFCVFTSPCLFILVIGPEDVGQFSMDKQPVAELHYLAPVAHIKRK